MNIKMTDVRPNNKEEMPLRHYGELYTALDPQEAALRTGVVFDESRFTIEILGHTLHAAHPDFTLTPVSQSCPAALTKPAAEILIMRMLLRGAASPWSGRLLAYRELPWGEVYDSNFNGRCRIRLAYAFGSRRDDFMRAARALGGKTVGEKPGEAACDLPLPCGITVRMIVREGDDEFPPSSQILFSDNVSTVWDAEDLAAMGELIISALKEQ